MSNNGDDILDWSNSANQASEKCNAEFSAHLDNQAERLTLIRGTRTVTDKEVFDAQSQLMTQPEQVRHFWSHIFSDVGVFFGAIMVTAGFSFETLENNSLLLILGGILVAILSSALKYHRSPSKK